MSIWLISIIAVWSYVSGAYLLSRILKRNDIMDILWGLGFAMLAILNLILTDQLTNYKIALFGLIVLWALRLSLHIFIKNKGKEEDFRYQNMRKNWGQSEWWRSYLQIYLLQGFFMLLIALPIIDVLGFAGDSSSFPRDSFFLLPTFIALIGLGIEGIADFQKSIFKKSNPHGLMKTGLWKYSRHPNYFGEAVFWWGIALFTIIQHPILGLISAVTITLLLRYVSGVPMLEKAKEGNAAYEQYKKETPVFVPFLKP